MEDYTKAILIRRDSTKKNKCVKIHPNNYNSDKFLLFCPSGNGTVTEKSANGFCKLGEQLLRLLFNGRESKVQDYVDLIGIVYPQVSLTNPSGKLNVSDVNNIVDYMLFTKCLDENDDLLSVDEACRNMSRVGFFSFCGGAREVAHIMMNLGNKLVDYGYLPSERDEIFKSMRHVSFAPYVDNDLIPSVRIDSFLDTITNKGLFKDGGKRIIGEKLDGIAIKYECPGTMKGEESKFALYGSIHIYSSQLRNIVKEKVEEHNVVLLSRDLNWDNVIKWVDGVEMQYSPGKNADAVSQMAAWALSRMVENGLQNAKSDKHIKPMNLFELKDELESIKNSFSPEDLMARKY